MKENTRKRRPFDLIAVVLAAIGLVFAALVQHDINNDLDRVQSMKKYQEQLTSERE